jgi:hypothetical protein
MTKLTACHPVRLTAWLGIGATILLLAAACESPPGPIPTDSGSPTEPTAAAVSSGPIQLRGSGNQESELITTDDSLYSVRWNELNPPPDASFPTLGCPFEIVYYKAAGAGAVTGGGGFGATTLHIYTRAGNDAGGVTFRPHPGQGYLSITACDSARYAVVMQKA